MNQWLHQSAQFLTAFPALGGWLLCLLKSSAIISLAAGTACLLHRQSARTQNWVWRSSLAVLLLLIAWQALPTGWKGFAWRTEAPAAVGPIVDAPAIVTARAPASDSRLTQLETPSAATPPSIVAGLESFIAPVWWGIASTLVMIQLVRMIAAARWLKSSSTPAKNGDVVGAQVHICGFLHTPVLAGFFRPSIYLPASAKEWDSNKLNYVCSHEMAHWSRGDLLWQLAGTLACCLWWWNPLVWAALRKLKATAEQATDDLVVLRQGTPREYARCLVEIASEKTLSPRVAMSVPMLGYSSLEARVKRIVEGGTVRDRLGAFGAGILSVLLVLIVFCAATNLVLGEAAPAGSRKTVHFQADPKNNVLPQGVFAQSKGKLEGWTGSLGAASFPERGFLRIKADTEEATLETKIPRQPEWDWLTFMVRSRPAPGTTMADHQGSTSVVLLDGAGKPLSTPVSFELNKRTGYVNWGNRLGSFQLPSEAKEIVVRIQLLPGPGQLDISELYLIPTNPNEELDRDLVDRFYKSVKGNDIAAVKQQLTSEPRLVNARNGSGDNGTPLIVCAWNEQPEMAQTLIDAGADVKATDSNWKSDALTWCGWWGSPKTAEVLLKAGSDPKFKSVYGVTPLSSAKAGKKGNTFSKNTPEDYDRAIAIFERMNQ